MRPDEKVRYLDRRVTGTSPGVSATYAAGLTTWTLPYSVKLDGTEGLVAVVRTDTNAVLSSTRPAENKISAAGDLRAIPVYIGVTFRQIYQPTRFFPRSREGRPESRGRLILRYIDVEISDSTDLTVTVTRTGRNPTNTTLNVAAPVTRPVHVGLHSSSSETSLQLINDTPGGCSLVALDWEGTYETRSRRI